MAEQYKPKAARMADTTRGHIERAAPRSTSLQVLLSHIAYLEQQYVAVRTVVLDEFSLTRAGPRYASERMRALVDELERERLAEIRAAERAPSPIVEASNG